ncbi:uncharacterized protein VTP21DRAFT_2805 [Calcarisporiella thermophila]|uniref:uncharacterized protein n=1 Tax=Calcarisporiella thermophila TaxID=911321 RepID=UPI003744AA80
MLSTKVKMVLATCLLSSVLSASLTEGTPRKTFVSYPHNSNTPASGELTKRDCPIGYQECYPEADRWWPRRPDQIDRGCVVCGKGPFCNGNCAAVAYNDGDSGAGCTGGEKEMCCPKDPRYRFNYDALCD